MKKRILVHVKLYKKTPKISFIPGGTLFDTTQEVYSAELTKPPHDNQANRELKALLAEYFHCRLSQITIIAGHTSKQKVVELDMG